MLARRPALALAADALAAPCQPIPNVDARVSCHSLHPASLGPSPPRRVGGIRSTTNDAEHRRGRSGRGHRGMFPCFFGGRLARLLRSIRKARMTWIRVAEGSMTASM